MQAVRDHPAATRSSSDVSEASGIAEQVRRLTYRYMDLWSSHQIEEQSRMLTHDADLVNVIGERFHGREAIQALHEQLHRTIFAHSSSRIIDLQIKPITDNVCLVQAEWEMRGAHKLAGWNVPDVRTGWMTLAWIKQDGEWKVTTLHNTDTIPVPDLPHSAKDAGAGVR